MSLVRSVSGRRTFQGVPSGMPIAATGKPARVARMVTGLKAVPGEYLVFCVRFFKLASQWEAEFIFGKSFVNDGRG
jgi:hypothetical protein